MLRTLRTIYPPFREDIRDLVTRRPEHPMERLNPFLFINHHGPQVYPPRNSGLPFGPHPHRGFETVTFIVEGSLVHRDTAGHESSIGAGGIQWMTAGRGIEHSETSPAEFLRDGGPLEILQLWLNLPSSLKMTAPSYTGLQSGEIPELSSQEGSARVHLIAGEWDGTRGPVRALTGTALMTIDLEAGTELTLPAPRGRVVFLYVVRGEVGMAGQSIPEFHLADLDDEGDEVGIRAARSSLLIFGHAGRLEEPIAAYGPFVMNTQEEIVQAVRDYQAGRFRS